MGDDVIGGQVRIFPDHEQADRFAGLLVRDAYRGGFQNARVGRGDILYLVGIDVESGDDDHVLLAILDVEESLLVHAADVSGLQPAVVGKYLGSRSRPLPVSAHDLGTADADLADFAYGQGVAVVIADFHIRGWDRQADGAVELASVQRIGGDHGRGLRQPVSLAQACPGQLLPACRDIALNGHAAAQAYPQLAEVELPEVGVFQQRREQRVDAGDQRHRLARQVLDEARQIPRVGDQHVVTAEFEEEEQVHRQRKDVIQRQRSGPDVPGALEIGLRPGRNLQDVGDHVPVSEHGALGHAGGAAGVLQERDVVPRDLHVLVRCAPSLRQRGAVADRAGNVPARDHFLDMPDHEVEQHPLEQRELVPDFGDDDSLYVRVPDDLFHGMREILQHQDGFGAAVLELVFEFPRRVHRIDVDHHESRTQRREHRDGILQEVGHHDGNAVAVAQAAGVQEAGKVPAQLIRLPVGELHTGIGECR